MPSFLRLCFCLNLILCQFIFASFVSAQVSWKEGISWPQSYNEAGQSIVLQWTFANPSPGYSIDLDIYESSDGGNTWPSVPNVTIPSTVSGFQSFGPYQEGKYKYRVVASVLYDGSVLTSDPADQPGTTTVTTVKGSIVGYTANGVFGWACQTAVNSSINVEVYAGGPKGQGGSYIGTYPASFDSAVASICGTSGAGHRFQIAFSETDKQQHGGEAIYLYGLSSVGTSDKLLSSGSFLIPSVPPSVPGGVSATQPNPAVGTLKITWNASTGPVSYYAISVNNGADQSFSGSPAYIPGLSEGTYGIRVKSCDINNLCSNYSSPVNGIIDLPEEIPEPPTSVWITGSPSSNGYLTLNWSGATGSIDHYKIMVDGVERTEAYSGSPQSLYFTVNRTYSLNVQACNSSNQCSGYSSDGPKTGVVSNPNFAPGVPTLSVLPDATSNDGLLHVSWNNPEGAVTHYMLSQNGGTYFQVNQTYWHSPVLQNATYSYRVKACYQSACSSPSNSDSATVLHDTPVIFYPPESNNTTGTLQISWQSGWPEAGAITIWESVDGGPYQVVDGFTDLNHTIQLERENGTYKYQLEYSLIWPYTNGDTNDGTITQSGVTVVNKPPSFSVSDANGAEGSKLAFSITRSGTLGQENTIYYETENDEAVDTQDYFAVAPTLVTFAAGETEKEILIQTRFDDEVEPEQHFRIKLSGAGGEGNPVIGRIIGYGYIANSTGSGLDIPSTSGPTIPISWPASSNQPGTIVTVTLERDFDENDGDNWVPLSGSYPSSEAVTYEDTVPQPGSYRYRLRISVDYDGGEYDVFYSYQNGRTEAVFNDSPNAVDDPDVEPYYFTALNTQSLEVDVLANDSDPQNDPLTIIWVEPIPSEAGEVQITQAGTKLTYYPESGYSGDLAFQYRISDGNGNEATANVWIRVFPASGALTIDDSPIDDDGVFTISWGVPATAGIFYQYILYELPEGLGGPLGDSIKSGQSNQGQAKTDQVTIPQVSDGVPFMQEGVYTYKLRVFTCDPACNDYIDLPGQTEVKFSAPQFSIENTEAYEGNPLEFKITRSGSVNSLSETSSITYYTVADDGSQTDPAPASDYQAVNQSPPVILTFASGQTELTAPVITNDNQDFDDPASRNVIVKFEMADGSDGIIIDDSAVGVIKDDESLNIPSFSIAPAADTLEGSQMEFEVTRSGSQNALDQTSVVEYYTSAGNADPVNDFTPIAESTPEEITFLPGQTTGYAYVDTLPDPNDERQGSRTVFVNIKMKDGNEGNIPPSTASAGGDIVDEISNPGLDAVDDPNDGEHIITQFNAAPIFIDVLANDTPQDGSLSVLSVQSSSDNGGTVVNQGNGVTYAPPNNFLGVDQFTYTISDGQGGEDTATVTVEVEGSGSFSINPPLSEDGYFTISWDFSINPPQNGSITQEFWIYDVTDDDTDYSTTKPDYNPVVHDSYTLGGDPTGSIAFYRPAISKSYKFLIKMQICSEPGCMEIEGGMHLVARVEIEPPPGLEPVTEISANTDATLSQPYSSNVTAGGNVDINIPIQIVPGVNGLTPGLTLSYNSGRSNHLYQESRAEGALGYGWAISKSEIRRCVAGTEASRVEYNANDNLCLDGQLLTYVGGGGSHLSPGAEYRTESESYRRIKLMSDSERNWFQVETPDGRILEYGRTEDSHVKAKWNLEFYDAAWSLNKVTDAFDNTIEYQYHKPANLGINYLDYISYGDNGDARIEFAYGAREDIYLIELGNPENKDAVFASRYVKLHTIRVKHDGYMVRDYRLNHTYNGDVVRLTKLQQCGYPEFGSLGNEEVCTEPLSFDWIDFTDVPAGFKTMVHRVRDEQGRTQEFDYGLITQGGSPGFLFSDAESPFGAGTVPVDAEALNAPIEGAVIRAVVTQHRASNGIGNPLASVEYEYQEPGLQSTKSRGFIGFYAQKITDLQSGIVTYVQRRVDDPVFYGRPTIVLQEGPSGEALSRVEHHYTEQLIDHPGTSEQTSYVYRDRSTSFTYEAGSLIGGTQTEFAPAFSGGFLTSATRTTKVTDSLSAAGQYNENYWGEVPAQTLGSDLRTSTQTSQFLNRVGSSEWLLGFVSNISSSSSDALNPAITRDVNFAPHWFSNKVDEVVSFPGDGELELTSGFDYDFNGNLTDTTLSGVKQATARSSAARYLLDKRYPTELSNAAGHTTNVNQYDLRFGVAKQLTDPNGRTASSTRDAFGRVTSITDGDGVTTNVNYQICGCAAVNSHPTLAAVIPQAKVTTSSPIAPTQIEYVDQLGRIVRTETESFDGTWVVRDLYYDERGRLVEYSLPYFAAANDPVFIERQYDLLNRVVAEIRPDGGRTDIVRSVNSTSDGVVVSVTETVVVPESANETRTESNEYNLLGQLVEATDALGTVTTYDYDSLGNPVTVVVGSNLPNPNERTRTFAYDAAGNQVSYSDPDTGTVNKEYSSFGELIKVTNASNRSDLYQYDALGRMTYRKSWYGSNRVHLLYYDGAGGIGYLDWIDMPGSYDKVEYSYTNGRLDSESTTVYGTGGANVRARTTSYAYDGYGRLDSVTYPDGFTAENVYNPSGYLSGLRSASSNDAALLPGQLLQSFDSSDAFGNVTAESYSNGVTTSRSFDPTSGRLASIDSNAGGSVIQDLDYAWRSNGILAYRDNQLLGVQEDFEYDILDRLEKASSVGTSTRSLDYMYDQLGNLLSKTTNVATDDQVDNEYLGARPHAVSQATINGQLHTLSYDADGAMTSNVAPDGTGRFLSYNSDNQPTKIVVGTSLNDSNYEVKEEFTYDTFGGRIHRKSVAEDDTGAKFTETHFYMGAYEEVEVKQATFTQRLLKRTLVSPNVMVVHTGRRNGWGSLTWERSIEFLHRDHQGSVEKVTDVTGAVLKTLAFDPYGGRRNADWTAMEAAFPTAAPDLEQLTQDLEIKLARGYTGHEHLDRTGLIHMNGRVYDPQLGRFLSPDPIVQAPGYSQSWNRYAYTFGSPVSFVDPSGFRGRCDGCPYDPDSDASARYFQLTVPSFVHDVDSSDSFYSINYTFEQFSRGYDGQGGDSRLYNAAIAIGGATQYWGQTTQALGEYVVNNPGQVANDTASVIVDSIMYFPDYLILNRFGVGYGADVRMNRRINGTLADVKSSFYALEAAAASGDYKAAGGSAMAMAMAVVPRGAARRMNAKVDIKNSTATVNFTQRRATSLSVDDINSLKSELKLKGVKSIIVNSGQIVEPTGRLRRILQTKADSGRTWSGLNVWSTGNPKNEFVLTGNL